MRFWLVAEEGKENAAFLVAGVETWGGFFRRQIGRLECARLSRGDVRAAALINVAPATGELGAAGSAWIVEGLSRVD